MSKPLTTPPFNIGEPREWTTLYKARQAALVLRERLAAAEAKLADERRHADALDAALEDVATALNDLLEVIPEEDPEQCTDVQPIHSAEGTEYDCQGENCWQCMCAEARQTINRALTSMPARRAAEVAR